jgi:hypothetical protein
VPGRTPGPWVVPDAVSVLAMTTRLGGHGSR